MPRPTAALRCLQRASYVLLGDVIDATSRLELIDEKSFRRVPQRVRLRVVEGFKGLRPEQGEFDLIADSNIEGTLFRVGRQYLVYASTQDGAAWVGTCTRTIEAEEFDSGVRSRLQEDLVALRRCSAD